MTSIRISEQIRLSAGAQKRMADFGLSREQVIRAHTARKPGNLIIDKFDIEEYADVRH